jgi:hypothetical protein
MYDDPERARAATRSPPSPESGPVRGRERVPTQDDR